MNKQHTSLFITAVLLIVFAALTRLFPHYPNFTAIGAMAIFGGAVVKNKKVGLVLPLVALFISDIFLQFFGISFFQDVTVSRGFYGGQLFVYAAFLIIAALATFIRKPGVGNIAFASLWAGIIFFVISNFGVWALSDHFYPKTIAGLMSCYGAALPFYKHEFFGNFLLNGIYANFFFSAILFGAYALVEKVQKEKHVIA